MRCSARCSAQRVRRRLEGFVAEVGAGVEVEYVYRDSADIQLASRETATVEKAGAEVEGGAVVVDDRQEADAQSFAFAFEHGWVVGGAGLGGVAIGIFDFDAPCAALALNGGLAGKGLA